MTAIEQLERLLDAHFPGWRDDPQRALTWIDDVVRRRAWEGKKARLIQRAQEALLADGYDYSPPAAGDSDAGRQMYGDGGE